MTKRLTTEEFITKAKIKHGNTYTYDKVVYKNTKTKVLIKCHTHGYFEQAPGGHLEGKGCIPCGREEWFRQVKGTKRPLVDGKPISADKFFSDASIIHNNKYTYLRTDYKNITTKISITCPEHGEFMQTPWLHKRTTGCPKCGDLVAKKKNTLTKKEFIERARSVHGNYYNYSKLNYINISTKMTIECPVHGMFKQTGYHHTLGRGCSKCATSGFNPAKPAIVYYLKINNGEAYKIGITGRSVTERFTITDLTKIEVILQTPFIDGQVAKDIESSILNNNTSKRYSGDKILDSGNTELFTECILTELEKELYHRDNSYEKGKYCL